MGTECAGLRRWCFGGLRGRLIRGLTATWIVAAACAVCGEEAVTPVPCVCAETILFAAAVTIFGAVAAAELALAPLPVCCNLSALGPAIRAAVLASGAGGCALVALGAPAVRLAFGAELQCASLDELRFACLAERRWGCRSLRCRGGTTRFRVDRAVVLEEFSATVHVGPYSFQAVPLAVSRTAPHRMSLAREDVAAFGVSQPKTAIEAVIGAVDSEIGRDGLSGILPWGNLAPYLWAVAEVFASRNLSAVAPGHDRLGLPLLLLGEPQALLAPGCRRAAVGGALLAVQAALMLGLAWLADNSSGGQDGGYRLLGRLGTSPPSARDLMEPEGTAAALVA